MSMFKPINLLLILILSSCTFKTSSLAHNDEHIKENIEKKSTLNISQNLSQNLSENISQKTDSQLLQNLVENYLNKTPVNAINQSLTIPQAQQIQNQFVEEISKTLGPIIGYKAGLTNQKAQQSFNVSQPLRGSLLQKMLIESGAVISANFGSRPFSEGDLIVRVGSEKINNAKTPRETLKYLDAVIPFLELPDLVYSQDVKLNAPAILAINIGARAGVLGNPIPLADTDEWENRLKNMRLEIFDENGEVLASGNGSDLLGHPLNVVLWIKDSLQGEGKQLKKGDLLSLGSITNFVAVKSNTTIRAKYIGLAPNETVEIFVKFE